MRIKLRLRVFLAPLVLRMLIILIAVPPLALPQGPGPGRFPGSGLITRVSDGDSLWVRFADGGERRLRLIGVNSPELNDPREEEAFRGFLAKRFAEFHLRGRNVRLEYGATPVDDYGRILAYVWTEDGRLFNELIIREGFAYAFLRYPFRRDYQARFRQAEDDARREGLGLWHSGRPETIAAAAAVANLGRCVRVRFDCATVTRERGFIMLRSAAKDFEAIVPLDRRSAFPALEDYAGRTVAVTGFLEAFRGRPQILLQFPRQLAVD